LSRLTTGNLAAALTDVTTNPHRAARSQALSARLRAEDGATRVLQWLESR
jgi:UDP:flavonoid glycosyltransferase YjiC (YdhE family)